jgi:hypothetical protein
MLKKFKLSKITYLFVLLLGVCSGKSLLSTFYYDNHNFLSYFIYSFCFICAFYGMINMAYFYIGVDEKGITDKTLTSYKFISWDDICHIGLVVSNVKFFLFKYSISIHGNGKKVNITNWTHNSKELIKIIVAECKKRNIKVELMVEKIIED